jgi:hypothetical protein
MEKLGDALLHYFFGDGLCLIGVLASAVFCAWFVWMMEMRPEVQAGDKNWWHAPLGEVIVAFILGAIFWPLGLIIMAFLIGLYLFGGAPRQRQNRKTTSWVRAEVALRIDRGGDKRRHPMNADEAQSRSMAVGISVFIPNPKESLKGWVIFSNRLGSLTGGFFSHLSFLSLRESR